MQLFVTLTSPYARMVRIVVMEKGLDEAVTVEVAKTRTANSPYYQIVPSGRVPALVRPGQTPLEESGLICAYLDRLAGGGAIVQPPEAYDWEMGRLEAFARSYLDGLAVLVRELRRPENEQSPTIVAHEIARAKRCAGVWEREVVHPVLQETAGEGVLNMAQITLAAALGSARRMAPGLGLDMLAECDPFLGHPNLAGWARQMAQRRSVADIIPELAE